jgi:[ribosomal protein S18]-alanine N-acetyltransferase
MTGTKANGLVRRATSADIPAIMALASRASTAAHWSGERYQHIFTNSAPRRIALLIEERSLVCAFLIARVLDSEIELENIVVADSQRRLGLGKQLLEEFRKISQTEGARTIFLEVRETNLPARKLYEKCGFAENGRRRDYYTHPEEDAVLYQLLLV